MEFVRACALRLGIVAVGAAALLVPTARAALSATTTDTGSTWSTAADFSSCSAAAWDSTTVYHAGDVVAYNDDTWEAQWYTVGDEPGAPGSTMWSDLGSCSPPPPGTCSTVSWNVNVAYHKGDLVSYAGDTWRARFYSVGATPGAADQYGPWTDLGPCTS